MKRVLSIFIALALTFPLAAQEITMEWLQEHYTKREVMIPMRDGISLSTTIYEPIDVREGGAPIMMTRTPYGLSPYGQGYAYDLTTYNRNYVRHGYIMVYQSVRGTFLSEGEFINIRPFNPHKTGSEIDEASDTYDSVEWLLANTSSNGSVGIKGVSYPGFYSTMAALSGHPAIKAVSPQAPVTDWWKGDDTHHNGAYFMADMFSFGASFFKKRYHPTTSWSRPVAQVDTNVFDYFLTKDGIADIMKPYGDSLAFWNDVVAHPDYDDFWKERNATKYLRKVKPAMMVVGGEYDAEDCYGAWHTYKMLKKQSPKTETYFVEGPWYHGAWRDLGFDHMDDSWFGTESVTYYLDNIEYPFFAYYLEGIGDKPAPVQFLPSGETAPEIMKDRSSTGLWETLKQWPRKDIKYRKHFLGGDGRIAFKAQSKASRSYISDPSDPVPYFHKVKQQDSRDRDYMAGDQREPSQRPDVLVYESEILTDTLKLEGPVKVHLRTSITTDDADFIVKVIDVRPDGYQMLVRGEVMPARYRKSLSKAVAAKPGKAMDIDYTMPDIAHHLMPGHKLMIQVQSSWYPLVAMNPQNLEAGYYTARAADYRTSTVTIYGSSYVALSVVK